MTTEHTPGPWRYCDPIGDDGVAYWAVTAGNGYPDDAGFGFSMTGFVSEADAKLLAAAPDLLEALKAILPWHDSHSAEATDNPLINQCRAAIAKATQP